MELYLITYILMSLAVMAKRAVFFKTEMTTRRSYNKVFSYMAFFLIFKFLNLNYLGCYLKKVNFSLKLINFM